MGVCRRVDVGEMLMGMALVGFFCGYGEIRMRPAIFVGRLAVSTWDS